MSTSASGRFAAVALLAMGLLWAGEARGDIPSVTMLVEPDGDRVRLDLQYGYHGSNIPSCDTLVERRRSSDGAWRTVFDGDLGEASYTCECSKWFTWQEGDPDAEGELCEPDPGDTAVQGSCPVGHSCSCRRQCEPYYDAPCNGTWHYRTTPNGYFHVSGTSLQAEDGVEVVDGGACAEGGGCATARISPHLYVLLLFFMGAVIPWWIRRRRL